MRIKYLLAIASLVLLNPLSTTWAAAPVGAAVCVKCHDAEERPDNSKTAHGFSTDKRVPDCISCHGASDNHANNRRQPGVKGRPQPDILFGKTSKTPAHQRTEACLTCHTKDAKRALWSGSQHEAADVSCDACHKNHDNQDKVRNRASQPEVCYSCHKEQRSQMNKASHHPVAEGKMACSDCHNPHGSAGPKLLKRDSVNDTCYTCHAEKRGPFVHPHDPVADNCSNCHVAHGSNTSAMLTLRAPLLCQQCHSTSHTPASDIGVLTGGTPALNSAGMWQGRSCLNCHTQVHGSNNPSTTLMPAQRLMR
ncbi:MAG: cytochrome C [Comamonadaceae bacterium CG1_02_60_18]|nr:MAG: cytochrome C [Comamonadaceae bacterium CG1_02_60_18]PIQ52575.1 MAG: cytochrome C [Comamonadaceae bacterium CG12_big_fil_rev_8_21_14_0_65_59_15]